MRLDGLDGLDGLVWLVGLVRLVDDLGLVHHWLLVEYPGLLLHYLSRLGGWRWWRLLVDDCRLLHTGLPRLVEDAGLGLHHGLLEGNLVHRPWVGTISRHLVLLVLLVLVQNTGLLQYGLVVDLLLLLLLLLWLGLGLLFSHWLTDAEDPGHRLCWWWLRLLGLLNDLLELLLLLLLLKLL